MQCRPHRLSLITYEVTGKQTGTITGPLLFQGEADDHNCKYISTSDIPSRHDQRLRGLMENILEMEKMKEKGDFPNIWNRCFSFSLSPFHHRLSKTSHELQRNLYNESKSNLFDKIDEVVWLLTWLRKLYVRLNEHYILKKREIKRFLEQREESGSCTWPQYELDENQYTLSYSVLVFGYN